MDLTKKRQSPYLQRYQKKFDDTNMELKHLTLIHKIPFTLLYKHRDNLERFILKVYEYREGKTTTDKTIIYANQYYEQFFKCNDI